jgi:trimethylamine:corrinoid methyltransferase-like protein
VGGGETLLQRARARVDEILESHVPEPLPLDVQKQIDAIANRARDA